MIVVKYLEFQFLSDFINFRKKVYHHQPQSKVSFEKIFYGGGGEKYLEFSFESDCVSPAILEKADIYFSVNRTNDNKFIPGRVV